jgi:hypothetical protein
LRNTFTGRYEQALVNMACLEDALEQIDEPLVPYPSPDASK